MNKGLVIGLSATAVAIGGILAYNYFVPPSFKINEASVGGCGQGCRNINGSFDFGSIKNRKFDNQSLGASGVIGREFLNFGWNLVVGTAKDGVVFELMKNGKKVKTLIEYK
jgi:hypothetical protein